MKEYKIDQPKILKLTGIDADFDYSESTVYVFTDKITRLTKRNKYGYKEQPVTIIFFDSGNYAIVKEAPEEILFS